MATKRSGDKMTALGDSLWNYNPITPWINFLRGATGQYGLINVNSMKTEEPEAELDIVNSVGSYGKQLGRVIEALQAVCERLDHANWTPEQREAVKDFIRLAEDIDKYKREHLPVRKGSVDDIQAAIRTVGAAIRNPRRAYPQFAPPGRRRLPRRRPGRN